MMHPITFLSGPLLSICLLISTSFVCRADEAAYRGSAFELILDYEPLSGFNSGIQILPDTCGFAESQIEDAITNARLFARAGLEAARSTDTALFNTFFADADREMVATVYTNIIEILSKRGTYPVIVTCKDIKGMCPRSIIAYLIKSKTLLHSDTLAPIVICKEKYAAYRPLPDPCNKNSLPQTEIHRGGSQALILLHELIHIDYIAGPSLKFIGDHGVGSFAATILRNKLDVNGDLNSTNISFPPNQNDDNYAVLAAWAWMQHEQRHRCPNNFPLWNEVARLSGQGGAQLRTLLVEGDGETGVQPLSDENLRNVVNGVGREDTVEIDEISA